MTTDEARERVGEIRALLRRAMGAINKTDPDWGAAGEAASECVRLCAELQTRCWLNVWGEKHGDGDDDGYVFGERGSRE